ncbi:MAG: serine hydrolase domain-containing protein [Acidobacteriota bacterium]
MGGAWWRVVAAACLIGLATTAAAQDKPVVTGEVGRKLDEYLTRLERFGYAGGALAVRGQDVLLMKSYGLGDRAKGLRLTTESVYNLGSITKQFTAAAILTLEVQGKLSISDPITRYFKDVPPDKAGITLHHLLTHSSGLESDFSPTDYDPVGRDEYVRRALISTLLFKPGEGYEYSNSGYSLLAAIVEIVSGQSYETYLIEKVLKPAGMLETGYKAPGWDRARIAHGYRDGRDWGTILERIQPPDAPYWMLRGNGGLHTTLGDLLAWHRALATDAVLPAASREKFFKPYVAEGPRGLSHYAYGWAVSRTPRGTTLVQHNGGNGIYVAEFLRFVDEDTMLFLTSTDANLKATPVVEVLERIVFGGSVAMPPAVVDLDPAKVAAHAGAWEIAGGVTLTLKPDGPALVATPADAGTFAALNPVPEKDTARFEQVSARTADITARAFRGDVTGLHEALGGGMPLDEIRAQEQSMMRDRVSRLGPFRGSSVLGTVPRDGDTTQTIVRLEFERGAVFNVYVWGPRRILGIRGMPQLPNVRFLPISETAFVAFSLEDGGTERRLTFATEGSAPVLKLTTPGGSIVARRPAPLRRSPLRSPDVL